MWRRSRRARCWPPPGINPWGTSADYLAFAVAQPELERRAARMRSIVLDVMESSRRNWHGPMDLRTATQVRIEAYVAACYAVSDRFTGEDCNVLRMAGILPREFFADVDKEVRALYQSQRRQPTALSVQGTRSVEPPLPVATETVTGSTGWAAAGAED